MREVRQGAHPVRPSDLINSYQRRIQSLEEQVAIISKSVGYADGFKELNPIENLSTFKKYTEEDVTTVFVTPKYTEDYNNYAAPLFNLMTADSLPAATLTQEATIAVAKVRFDWNSVAACQSLILKEGYAIDLNEVIDNVENTELNVNIYSNNGSVYVETEAGAMIEVYTVNGLRVYAGVSNTTTTIINGLNTNIAIIRVNGTAYKVFVK